MSNKKLSIILLAIHLVLIFATIFWYVSIYESEEKSISKSDTIDFILSEQENDGGFSYDTIYAIKLLYLLNSSHLFDENNSMYLGIDDDADGEIDEDYFDGKNNDGDVDAWGNELIDEDSGYIDWNNDFVQDTTLGDFLISNALSKLKSENLSIDNIYDALKILELIDSLYVLDYNCTNLNINSSYNLSTYLYISLNKSKNEVGYGYSYESNSSVFSSAQAAYSLYILNRSYLDPLNFIISNFTPINRYYFFSSYMAEILVLIDFFETIDNMSFFNSTYSSENFDDDSDGEIDEDKINFKDGDSDFFEDEDPASVGDFDSDGINNTYKDYILKYVTYEDPDIDHLDRIYVSYKLGYRWEDAIDFSERIYSYQDSDGDFEDIETTYYAIEILNHYNLLKLSS